MENKGLFRTFMMKGIVICMACCLMVTLIPMESYAASKTSAKPKITKAVVYDSNNVKLQWSKAQNAVKYKIYRKKADGKFVLAKTTGKRTYNSKKLAYGSKYTFKVTAITKTGKKSTSKIKTVYTKPAKPVIAVKAQNNNQVKITWKKASGAVKYKVYRKKSGGKFILVKTTTNCSFINKKLAYDTEYAYKVTAVSKAGATNASKIKKVMTLTQPPAATDKPQDSAGSNNPENPMENKPSTPGSTGPTPSEPANPDVPEDTIKSLEQLRKEVVALVNVERSKAGLAPMETCDMIDETAQVKAEDMRSTRDFNHYSETLGYVYDQFTKAGVQYTAAGENIAWGVTTAEAVMAGWMNSPGHKANILSKDFTHIGIGYADGYWAQQFAGIEPGTTVETCIYCEKRFMVNSDNTYNSTDAEGNKYYLFQCPHCIQLIEKCPKCEDGYFETVGLTQWGSQAEKCNVCGNLMDATCIEYCPSCDAKIWNKETDRSNTDSVQYIVTFDSTQSYDGKKYDAESGCYFQQFLVSANVCKSCGTHAVVDRFSADNYREFYQLLKENLGTEANIFDYIKWEKQVDLIYKGQNGSLQEYESIKKFVETPKITDLSDLINYKELDIIE